MSETNEHSAAPRCYAALHQNVWTPDLYRLYAEEYHQVCESYDRTVCSNNWNGVAMPRNGREAGLVNRNARQVLNRLAARASDELGKQIEDVLPELRLAIRRFEA